MMGFMITFPNIGVMIAPTVYFKMFMIYAYFSMEDAEPAGGEVL
jgi:hypothetical protein